MHLMILIHLFFILIFLDQTDTKTAPHPNTAPQNTTAHQATYQAQETDFYSWNITFLHISKPL